MVLETDKIQTINADEYISTNDDVKKILLTICLSLMVIHLQKIKQVTIISLFIKHNILTTKNNIS